MIELLKIHALVRAARVLVFVGAAADYVRKAACRKAETIAIEAVAWCDAKDAAYRRARPGTMICAFCGMLCDRAVQWHYDEAEGV